MPDCSTCSSGLRATVEALATEGRTPTLIARHLGESSPSISSIRRHLEQHWIRPGIKPAERKLDAAQAVGGLFDQYDAADAIRLDAEQRGDAGTALKAIDTATRAMVALSREHGVTSKVVADKLVQADQLFTALVRVGRADPDAVRPLADAAKAGGADVLAASIYKFTDRHKEKSHA